MLLLLLQAFLDMEVVPLLSVVCDVLEMRQDLLIVPMEQVVAVLILKMLEYNVALEQVRM